MFVSLIKSFLGVFVLFLALYLSVYVFGEEPLVLEIVHIPSLCLVGGTLIGVSLFLMEFPDYLRFGRFVLLYNVTKEKKRAMNSEQGFEKMLDIYTSQGREALAKHIKDNDMPYIWQIVATKLQIQVPVSDIKRILNYKLQNILPKLDQDIVNLRQMAALAPALGMLGTVLGLIRLLANMQDFSSLGPNMSLALVATLYGIFLSNIVFVPLARRVEKRKYMVAKNHANIIHWLTMLEENKPSFYLKNRFRELTSVG